jgi:hypothetical protein
VNNTQVFTTFKISDSEALRGFRYEIKRGYKSVDKGLTMNPKGQYNSIPQMLSN